MNQQWRDYSSDNTSTTTTIIAINMTLVPSFDLHSPAATSNEERRDRSVFCDCRRHNVASISASSVTLIVVVVEISRMHISSAVIRSVVAQFVAHSLPVFAVMNIDRI